MTSRLAALTSSALWLAVPPFPWLLLSQSLCPQRREETGICPNPGRAEKGPWSHQCLPSYVGTPGNGKWTCLGLCTGMFGVMCGGVTCHSWICWYHEVKEDPFPPPFLSPPLSFPPPLLPSSPVFFPSPLLSFPLPSFLSPFFPSSLFPSPPLSSYPLFIPFSF